MISLLPHTPEHLRAMLEGTEVYERRFGLKVAEGIRDFLIGPEVSAEFMARLEGDPAGDLWKDGFGILDTTDHIVIGLCSFTGPPGADGTVEIAYGIAPAYQGRGYATKATEALIAYAIATGLVRTIRAHTLPQHNASTRVLLKCGFKLTQELEHPHDGLVWRWERPTKLISNQV